MSKQERPAILVTGVNGFVGHHLTNELKSRDCRVYGVGQQPGAASDLSQVLDAYFSVDLTVPDQVATLPLSEVSAVISLAGLADVGRSFKEPERYMQVNTAVINNLNRALLDQDLTNVRHIAVSTGAVYDSSQAPPFHEDSRLTEHDSPYVASKIAMEKSCQDFRQQGVDLVIVRPFNHIGPGQEPGFLLPDLVSQTRHAITEGEAIKVGNLETRRDYTDVRDVARAYGLLALAKTVEWPVYNVCSGRSVSGQKILEMVLDQLAHDQKPAVVVDPAKFRPSDAPNIYGDFSRLHRETGWQPAIPIEKTVEDFIGIAQGRPSISPSGAIQPAG